MAAALSRAGGAPGAVTLALVLAAGLLVGGTTPLTYAQDVVYVHLVVARNVAADGTWGMLPGVAGAPTTSPLWTALLALAAAIVPERLVVAPFALALVAMVSLAVLLTLALPGPPARRALATIAVAIVGCWVPLVATGLEHVAHAAVAVVFVAALGAPRALPVAGVAAALLPALRPESAFLIAPAVVALVATRRPGAAAVVAAAALASVAWTAWALALPLSAPWPQPVRMVAPRPLENLVAGRHLALMVPAVWLVAGRGRLTVPIAVWTAAVMGQLGLGGVGQAFRYEAWLLTVGAALAVAGWGPRPRRAWQQVVVALGAIAAVAHGLRAFAAAYEGVAAQRALLGSVAAVAAARPDGAVVGTSNGGLVAWEAGPGVVELGCRTDPSAAPACAARGLDAAIVAAQVDRYDVAWLIAHPGWDGLVPAGFTCVATWRLDDAGHAMRLWATEPEPARGVVAGTRASEGVSVGPCGGDHQGS